MHLTGQSERTGIENKWYAITGRVVALKAETDGDLHIELQDATGDKPGIVVVELPPKPQWCEIQKTVFSLASTQFPFHTSSAKKLNVTNPPIVTVVGKAFFDVGHSLKDQRANRRSHLPNYAAWEIHRASDVLSLRQIATAGNKAALGYTGRSVFPQMQYNEDHVLGVLQDGGLVTSQQIDGALSRLNGEPGVLDVLIDDGILSEVDLSRTLAAQAHMDWIDISTMIIPPQVINEIRGEDARRFKVIPVAFGESGLVVAVGNPLDIDTIDSLSFLLQRELELVCTSPKKIREGLIKYYGTADEAADVLQKELGEDIDLGLELGDGAEPSPIDEADAPIVRLVSMLLIEAHRAGASDIHLEPMDKKFRVRFRIDGVLQEMQSPPKRLQSAIVSRLKIMTGSISIAEKRLPQDGRIQVRIKKKPVDLRVSTMPSNHGESMVLRILDKSSLKLGLPELGFLSDDQETFERLIRLPDGILLVTGPTGSGKTTTLYACLNYINKPDRKIITVEEPIEYQMTGINQVQVNTEIGMTFPAALRSILRQAPNIIMIGEIRDLETASIATNASLTGHLVFSTLHTNDAPSSVARLIDLGVQPFLVASSVRAVIAQRLVRRLCNNCKQPGELTDTELRALRIEPGQLSDAQVMRPVGCELCRQIGYKGRMGIFEIFVIDDEVRHMINKRTSTFILRQKARELGMRTLREDGVRKVLAGLTSADEVISITVGDVS